MKQFFKNIRTGIYNFWFFRKVIWDFRWWDYSFNLELFSKSLEYTSNKTEAKGMTRDKEELVQQMRRVIYLLNRIRSDEFIKEAEDEIGYELKGFDFKEVPGKDYFQLVESNGTDKIKSRKVVDLARKLEEENWKEIWKIIDGKMRNWWD